MVNFIFSTLAFLALTPVVTAVSVPDATNTTSVTTQVEQPFSISQWVEEIIANPNGTHLSAEQAWETYKTTVVDNPQPAGTLQKRVRCNIQRESAPAPDAVKCIEYLAGLGTTRCEVTLLVRFAVWGNAEIVGVSNEIRNGKPVTHSSHCNDIARAAGKIMDNCWRADNTVQGDESAWGNGNIRVHIARKGSYKG
ncbi:hypothetical protein QBC38DRAFT_365764 [Podospora fimiseda]|uniref:Ecp2 effector protein domain-containing protein n=1 Tax=Podospora fimiseda TaxID=252190 RepID=A0AAN7GXR7_9PEZI|nr:hypothetical protein QBC38DRAFT_365764 [Podospora fimiseda]